jgi:uncharacterized protein
MARLWALADLHLSLSGAKPMVVFGELWHDHAARMAAAWDAAVGDEDGVLLAGDLSWARGLEEAREDLAWVGARPGRKLLLRGNHDSWWASLSKVRRALPAGCVPLQNDAHLLAGRVIVGARGWTAPGGPAASEHDRAVFEREIGRLRLSLADAERKFDPGIPRAAMLHYPPWVLGYPPTEVVAILREGRVRDCVYGHLHGEDHRLAVRGEHEGIRFHFAAADATGFAPIEIP